MNEISHKKTNFGNAGDSLICSITGFLKDFLLGKTFLYESLMLWKGHQSLKRYIRSKVDRWGFKFYAAAEAEGGYIWSLLVDEGAQTDFRKARPFGGLQVAGKIVMSLVAPLLGRGHLLCADNFYSDIVLFHHLFNNKTSCLGLCVEGNV